MVLLYNHSRIFKYHNICFRVAFKIRNEHIPRTRIPHSNYAYASSFHSRATGFLGCCHHLPILGIQYIPFRTASHYHSRTQMSPGYIYDRACIKEVRIGCRQIRFTRFFANRQYKRICRKRRRNRVFRKQRDIRFKKQFR